MGFKPVTFLIRENKRRYTVYATLIAYYLRLLGDIVNKYLLEARDIVNKHLLEAKVSCFLVDINKDIFVQFAQYTYTRDYLSTNPKMVFKKI